MKKSCPECRNLLTEVRKIFDPLRAKLMKEKGYYSTHGDFFYDYPKDIVEPGHNKVYHEYRFVCIKCKKEWVYDSLWRQFLEVPKDSQFFYSWDQKMLILRK